MKKPGMRQWVFLSKTRSFCFSLSLVVLFITLIQTIYGKYGSLILWIWLLDLVLVIPALVLLWTNRRLQRFSGRIVSKAIHRLFVWFTISYYLLILLIILLEPLIIHKYGWSGGHFRIWSSFFLYPLEGILLWLYWLLFYRGRFQLTPNKNLLAELIDQPDKDGRRSQDDFTDFQKKCYELVAENNLMGAFHLMRDFFEKHHRRKNKETILLQRQFNEASNDLRLGLVTYERVQTINSRIAFAILEMIG